MGPHDNPQKDQIKPIGAEPTESDEGKKMNVRFPNR